MRNRTDKSRSPVLESLWSYMLQGRVLDFATCFPSKPGKGILSLLATPHRHEGKLRLQLPLASEARREGWSLRPAQRGRK